MTTPAPNTWRDECPFRQACIFKTLDKRVRQAEECPRTIPCTAFLLKFSDLLLTCSLTHFSSWHVLLPDYIFGACLHAQSSLTLSNPMDCSLPVYSVHGISQARILEWVPISSSRGSSWSRDQIGVFCVGRWILHYCTTWACDYTFICLLKWMRKRVLFSLLLYLKCPIQCPNFTNTK